MKIISTPETPKAPVTAAKPAAVPLEIYSPTPSDMESWKNGVLAEFHQFQKTWELARALQAEQLAQNAQAMAKLSEEVQSLRKALAERPRPELKTPPPAEPPTPPVPPISKTPVDPPVEQKPRPMVPVPERKVAFLTKLWDYLNQVAFEAPLQKSGRIQ